MQMQIPLWLNPPYEGIRPSAEYHPGAGWLKENGRDPLMVKRSYLSLYYGMTRFFNLRG